MIGKPTGSDATAKPRILMLDDDKAYCDQLSAYLGMHGFNVVPAQTAAEFEEKLGLGEPDLILLDQRLGETTGTEVLKRIRGNTSVPCIIVTGLSDTMDRIINLEIGADDEIDKAVQPRELLARIRAVLRRGARPDPATATAGPLARAAAAVNEPPGWRFSVAARELRKPDGSLCRLTSAEFELLRILFESQGTPVSRGVLSERVFGRSYEIGDRAVDTVVKKLRQKIQPEGESGFIQSVRPVGYVFVGFPP